MKKSKQKTHINNVVFFDLEIFEDDRGSLIELFRSDCLDPLHIPVMAYFSETKPGVMRGPHEHKDQSDYFCFVGPANFELYLWERLGEEIYKEKHLVGKDNPVAVIVPPGVIHAYKNISETPGLVFNGPNKLYGGYGKCYPVDEIRHELDKNCPYV
jgi:dTDP-4-dehydrorhamnose 3,5-epimerase